jgi:hypothetical protein
MAFTRFVEELSRTDSELVNLNKDEEGKLYLEVSFKTQHGAWTRPKTQTLENWQRQCESADVILNSIEKAMGKREAIRKMEARRAEAAGLIADLDKVANVLTVDQYHSAYARIQAQYPDIFPVKDAATEEVEA